jgi:hypothetical protein
MVSLQEQVTAVILTPLTPDTLDQKNAASFLYEMVNYHGGTISDAVVLASAVWALLGLEELPPHMKLPTDTLGTASVVIWDYIEPLGDVAVEQIIDEIKYDMGVSDIRELASSEEAVHRFGVCYPSTGVRMLGERLRAAGY